MLAIHAWPLVTDSTAGHVHSQHSCGSVLRRDDHSLGRFMQCHVRSKARDAFHGCCPFLVGVSVVGGGMDTHAYYSSRYYGGLIPSILNILSCQGYLIINTIIGGQALGSVSQHLNATLGIVIIGLITLGVSFRPFHIISFLTSRRLSRSSSAAAASCTGMRHSCGYRIWWLL